MRIQLWSYNYAPEPQGIAPLSTVLARSLHKRGHEVLVVAGHPHYPKPVWGKRLRPYRERRDDVPILRLPLWVGRETGLERVRQELSFLASQATAAPILPGCDVLIAVSPSFPALAAAMGFSRLRRIPWVLWLQDIVTDGAASTGLLPEGPLLSGARRFERATYASASRIVVISEAFRQNLRGKGVADGKIVRIYNPMTLPGGSPVDPVAPRGGAGPRIIAMGNIGYSQGLDRIVEAFEANAELADLDASLFIPGDGLEAEGVRSLITTPRVFMPGALFPPELGPELRRSSLGLVSQRADVAEFNLPSKLMNYMAAGLPVIASVRPESETARIVRESGAGWVTDARDPAQFARTAVEVLTQPDELRARGRAGLTYADANFRADGVAQRFEGVLGAVAARR